MRGFTNCLPVAGLARRSNRNRRFQHRGEILMRRFALCFCWVWLGLVGAGTWAPLAWGQTGGDRLTVMKPDSNTVFRPTGVENGEFTAFKDGKKTVTEADRPFL